MNNNYIVGIDIGSANIYGSIGKADKQGNLKILAHNVVKSNGVKKGFIANSKIVTEDIKECIAELEKMVNIYITDVYVSISSGMCKLISSKGIISITDDDRNINYKDVERVLSVAKGINLEDDEVIIDIIPHRYIIDDAYDVKDPVGVKGTRLEVDTKVVVTNERIISEVYNCFKDLNINVKGTMISAESAASILFSEGDDKENVALVDVGEEKTDIAVYKQGKIIYVNSLQLGGRNISKDIAYCLKLLENQGEKLKTSIESTDVVEETISIDIKDNKKNIVDKEMVYEIIYARVEEILQLINEDIDNAMKDEKVDTVILYGGGISLFKYVDEVWKSLSEKNLCIVNKESITLQNPLIINSLGIVKHVFNELKLNYIDYNEENIQEEDKKEIDSKKSNNVMSKIKSFLNEYF